jgi:hypothetical protein
VADVCGAEGPDAFFDCQISIADVHKTRVDSDGPMGNWQSAIEWK